MYEKVFELHSELLKAMSHPKRLEIIHLLRDQELSVSEIQEMLDLPQANLSQHLMILRSAQIVRNRRDGKEIFYSLTHKNFMEASDLLREVLVVKYKNTEMESEFEHDMIDLLPLVHDPVCGMRLSPKTAGFGYKFAGEKHFFCASGCLEAFKKSPDKYL